MKDEKQSLWNKFRSGLFTNAQIFTGVTLSLLFTSGLVYAFTIANLNIFTPGTTISASQMNDNFTYVNERLAALAGGKFTVSSTSTFVYGSYVCCGSSTNRINFSVVDEDISGVADLGNSFLASSTFIADESRFYSMSIIGKLAASSTVNGTLSVQVTSGGATSTYVSLYMYTTDTSFKGANQNVFLNAGDKIEVVGHKACCGGVTTNFDSNVKFSLRKL